MPIIISKLRRLSTNYFGGTLSPYWDLKSCNSGRRKMPSARIAYGEVKLMKKGTPHIDYLPLIGCLILVIDPLLVFFPSVSGLYVIRTMAFPIFAYLLVEAYGDGAHFSRLVQKLLILAIAFEIPFDLNQTWKPFNFQMNNLFFTLFCGLLMLGVLSQKWNAALKIGAVAAIAALSCLLHFEYGPCGILTVLLFYTTRSAKWKYVLQICGLLILSCLYAQVAVRSEVIWMTAPGVISLPSGSHIDAQFFSALSLIPIFLCTRNGNVSSKNYTVYCCLPLAYLGIYLCRRVIMGF